MSASLSRRAAYERTRKRRSIAVATVSSLTVVAAIVLFVPRMPRWDRVRESFFSGERFADSFPRLLEAFVLDIKIFAWSTPAIVTLALLVAIARNSRSAALFPLRVLTIAYTDIMRGVPVILSIYLIGFGVPGLGLERPWNSPLLWGSVALVSLIGPIEILRQAGVDKSKFANFTPYVVAAVIFLMMTIPLTRTPDYLLERERRRTTGTRVR